MLRIATGIVLVLAGIIWILQGFSVAFAPESFMTGDRLWVVGGVVAAVGGVALVWWGVRSRGDSSRQSTRSDDALASDRDRDERAE